MRATHITLHIMASRARVYRALLDHRAIANWRAPTGMSCHVETFDVREGGAYRIALTDDDLSHPGKTPPAAHCYHGRFLTLIPGELIVQTAAFETDDPAFSGEMAITFTLSDIDGDTELVLVHENLPVGVSLTDNEIAWRVALGKLAALVESGDGA